MVSVSVIQCTLNKLEIKSEIGLAGKSIVMILFPRSSDNYVLPSSSLSSTCLLNRGQSPAKVLTTSLSFFFQSLVLLTIFVAAVTTVGVVVDGVDVDAVAAVDDVVVAVVSKTFDKKVSFFLCKEVKIGQLRVICNFSIVVAKRLTH